LHETQTLLLAAHTYKRSKHPQKQQKELSNNNKTQELFKDVHQTRTSDADYDDDDDDDNEEFRKLHRKHYLLATKEHVTY
jgi:hypothetical protein